MVVMRRIVRTLTATILIVWSAALTVAWWQTAHAIQTSPVGNDIIARLFPAGFVHTSISVGFVLVGLLVWFGVLAAAGGSVPGALFALLPAIGWWALRYLGQIDPGDYREWMVRGQDLWGAAVVVTVLIARLLPWRDARAAGSGRASRPIPASVIARTRSWGTPGNSVATDSFGSANAPIGRVGDRRVGQRLEQLIEQGSARLFHALRFGESDPVDVNHAVVVGNRVALVEVKVWKPGIYTWQGAQTLLRYDDRFRGGRSDLVEALHRCRRDLGPGIEIQAWIVVTPVGDAEQHTYVLDDSEAPDGVKLCRLDELERVRDWLATADGSPATNGAKNAPAANTTTDGINTELIRSLITAHRQHPASDEPALHHEPGRYSVKFGPRWLRQRARHQLRVGDRLIN